MAWREALLLGGIWAAMAGPAWAAGSHCSAEEEILFSCSVGKKAVSVCASPALTPTQGYLQYRFGPLGAPELVFPASTDAPRDWVRGKTLMFSGGGGAYLRFIRGNTQYVVYTAIGKGWGNKDGVAVVQKGKTVRHWPCNDVPVSLFGAALFKRAGLGEDPEEFELP